MTMSPRLAFVDTFWNVSITKNRRAIEKKLGDQYYFFKRPLNFLEKKMFNATNCVKA